MTTAWPNQDREPVRHDDHWEIPLTQGHVALVDLDAGDDVLERRWFTKDDGARTVYAVSKGADGRTVYLHRVVMGLETGDTRSVDHASGDGLDNRRGNLRVCTHAQNSRNQRKNRGSSSRYHGVSWNTASGKWISRVRWTEGGSHRSKSLGSFDSEILAAIARDVHGPAYIPFDRLQFFRLNFYPGKKPMAEIESTPREIRMSRAAIFHDDCIELPLNIDRSAFVDLDCPAWILSKTWSASVSKYGTAHAFANVRCDDGSRTVMLHRAVLGLGRSVDGMEVDHIDQDGLNNRRKNLRECTSSQNKMNTRPRRGTSRFRGVGWVPDMGKWRVLISWTDDDGTAKRKTVGYYTGEIEAAIAYDVHAPAVLPFDRIPFLHRNFQVKGGGQCP